MKPINIEITKACISYFTIYMEEPLPNVSVTIHLLSNQDKKIAEYTLQAKHYNKDLKFDLPADCLFPIRELADKLEEVVTAHCLGTFKLLNKPREAEVVPDETGSEGVEHDELPF